MTRDLTLRTTFDAIVHDYDELRPHYPQALIEDAIALSGLPPGGHILEIGCGPGTATLPFARRGYEMLCLELGPNLAAHAAAKCSAYPRVRVQTTSFEDWPLQPRAFDLVLSASAFHWIPAEIGYAKSAAALREGGSLALAWNRHEAADTPFFRAVRAYWQEMEPRVYQHARRPPPEEMERLFSWIREHIGKIHPILVGSIAHYNFVRIHPFDDGNGRGARILMNLLLMREHYPPAMIRNENRRQYIESLQRANQGDLAPFVEFVANSLIETENTILEDFS